MPPLFISFTVVWLLNCVLAFVVLKQRRTIHRVIRENVALMGKAYSAIMFANALAARDIHIPCDDCGNLMTPTDQIDIMTRPDGTLYVGHHSHNRSTDWGYVKDERA